MSIILLKVPAIFTTSYIDRLVEINKRYLSVGAVSETYGSLPSGRIGCTRNRGKIPDVNPQKLKTYIQYSRERGISFNYAMNSLWQNGQEFTKDGIKQIVSELDMLVDCGVEEVTVGSLLLIEIIKMNFPKLRITSSINLCVSTLHEVERLSQLGIDKVDINRFCNKDFHLLKALIHHSSVRLELLLNSLCTLFCNTYVLHQLRTGANDERVTKENFNYPVLKCMGNYLSNPNTLVCAGWIRPEDLRYYSELGYEYFKLDGRGSSEEAILSNIQIYLSQDYSGNFFDYFEFFNSEQHKAIGAHFSLNNKELDGYLEPFARGQLSCRFCAGTNKHCQSFGQKIILEEGQGVRVYKSMVRQKLNEYLIPCESKK